MNRETNDKQSVLRDETQNDMEDKFSTLEDEFLKESPDEQSAYYDRVDESGYDSFDAVYPEDDDMLSEASYDDEMFGIQLSELADEVVSSGTSARASGDLLREVLFEAGVIDVLSPFGPGYFPSSATLFDAFCYDKFPAVSRHFKQFFDVIARPGERLSQFLQPGDILLRRALGEGRLGHAAILVSGNLYQAEELTAVGLQPEGWESGAYAQVIEGGPFHHRLSEQFARRLTDEKGRVPHDSLLLRARRCESRKGVPPATPRVLTYTQKDVIDDHISIPAQHSLVRLSKKPETSADAVGMLEAVKSRQLEGIYCVNWKKSAQRALKLGSNWWTVIPDGDDAVLMLDPGDLQNGPPMIAFRRKLHPDCGCFENEKPFPPQNARLDAALLRTWKAYKRFRQCEIAPCSLTNIEPSGEPTVPKTCRTQSRELPAIKIKAFFCRPAKHDMRVEEPHNVIVPAGRGVILHWNVIGADQIRIKAITVDGKVSNVSLPDNGRINSHGQPSNGKVIVSPQKDTIYNIYASNSNETVESYRSVNVSLYQTKDIDGAKEVVLVENDLIYVTKVLFSSKTEIKSFLSGSTQDQVERFGSLDDRWWEDENVIRDVYLNPDQPKPKSNAPGLLKLVALDACNLTYTYLLAKFLSKDKGEDCEKEFRTYIVAKVKQFEGFGWYHPKEKKKYKCKGHTVAMGKDPTKYGPRHEAYGDILGWYDYYYYSIKKKDKKKAEASRKYFLTYHCPNLSSCGLFVRSFWQMLGARDHIKSKKTHHLDRPYKVGKVMSDIECYAKDCGAHREAPKTIKEFTDQNTGAKKGDVVFICKGSSQHILTIIDIGKDENNEYYCVSIDGGQATSKMQNDVFGTKWGDCTCLGVQKRIRKLLQKGNEVYLDDRPIRWWVDITKVRFFAHIIEPIVNEKGLDIPLAGPPTVSRNKPKAPKDVTGFIKIKRGNEIDEWTYHDNVVVAKVKITNSNVFVKGSGNSGKDEVYTGSAHAELHLPVDNEKDKSPLEAIRIHREKKNMEQDGVDYSNCVYQGDNSLDACTVGNGMSARICNYHCKQKEKRCNNYASNIDKCDKYSAVIESNNKKKKKKNEESPCRTKLNPTKCGGALSFCRGAKHDKNNCKVVGGAWGAVTGTDARIRERWYCALPILWKVPGYSYPYRKLKVILVNPANGKSVVCSQEDRGPRREKDNRFVGPSHETLQALGAVSGCTLHGVFADQSLPLGPLPFGTKIHVFDTLVWQEQQLHPLQKSTV